MYRALIAALAAPLMVAACATPTATAPAPEVVTVTAPAPEPEPAPKPEAPTTSNDDDLYMALLASEGVTASRATSIEVAQSVCEALDDGIEATTLAALAVSSGFTNKQAAAIVAAAIVVYCPWHEGAAA